MRATHRSDKTTRGWPRLTRRERQRIVGACGCRNSFLDCAQLKYPLTTPRAHCQVDCRGLRVAKQRAAQHHHPALVRKADALAARLGCRWAR